MSGNKGDAPPGALSARHGEKILVAAADARVLDLIQITLSGRGFQVVTAVDGEEALRRLTGAHPDLIVLDTKLPRKSGMEVLEAIKKGERSRTPVIVISSNASSESKLEAFRKGADDYVAKPFSPRELILRIRRILDRIEEAQALTMRVRRLESVVAHGERVLEESRSDLRSRLFRVGSVVGALQHVGEARDQDELIARFVETLAGYLEIRTCALFVLDEEEDVFSSRVFRGGGLAPHLVFSAGGALAAALTESARPVSLESLSSLPEAERESGELLSAGLTELFPVLAGGRLRGAIGVRLVGERAESTIELVHAVARSVAVALANQQALAAMHRSFLETSSLLIKSLEARHPGLAGHSERVSLIAVSLAERVGIGEGSMEHVRLGAQLHDLGLVHLYETLTGFAGPLEDHHRKEVVEAPGRAASHLSDVGPLDAVAEIIRHHHERWDGTGYPEGLGETSIPIGARIVAVANAFDALTHERPHRAAYGVEEALEILHDERATGFDPALVDALTDLVRGGEIAHVAEGRNREARRA